MTAAPGHNSTENGTVPPPDPPNPQPVPDAYRCGDLSDDEWEVLNSHGEWVIPSTFHVEAVRRARRKAPPLTPREGDLVEDVHGPVGQVVYTYGAWVVVADGENAPGHYCVDDLTVTDRPPKRPVRVWLTDEDVAYALKHERGHHPATQALIDACRALVDE